MKMTGLLAGLSIMIIVAGCAGAPKPRVSSVPAAKYQPVTPPVTQPRIARPLFPKAEVKPPSWALRKEHPKYPSSAYLTGLGVSDRHSVSAEEAARLDLAKSLEVNIKSLSKDFMSMEGSYFESLIVTEVNTILQGLNIKDAWHDPAKGVYYSFAVLDRKLAAAGIRDRIEQTRSDLRRYMAEGSGAESKGEVVLALSNFLSGYRQASSISPLKSALRVIISSTELSRPEALGISQSEFDQKIKGIAGSLKLDAVSGDNQVVQTKKGLVKPLVVRVYLERGSEKIAVSNIPVVFKFEKGSGELEVEKTTDAKGEAQTVVHQIASFEEENHTISAKLDYPSLLTRVGGEPLEQLLAPLRTVNHRFNYSIDIPDGGSDKPQGWNDAIAQLVNDIIANIEPGGSPVVGVLGFKDSRYKKVTTFSEILAEDFEAILGRAKNLQVKEIDVPDDSEKEPAEIAKMHNLNFYIKGSYRMRQKGLKVTAILWDTNTRRMKGSADATIRREDIDPEDRAVLGNVEESFPPHQTTGNYDDNLEYLVFLKPDRNAFNLSVWTNKNDYEIGEEGTAIYVKADRKFYLTLLNIDPNGEVTVILPNSCDKNNEIPGGVRVEIPGNRFNFDLGVGEPSGQQTIKAIGTLNRHDLPKELAGECEDMGSRFGGITRGATPEEKGKARRNMEALTRGLKAMKRSGMAVASHNIYVHEQGQAFIRGSRKIPLLGRPKKPIDMIGTFGHEETRQ